MTNYPIPENEAERLDALRRYQILDTEPEEAFDRVTRVAAAYFDVPIAVVSLVDDARQWFKSHHGIDADETPREVAFCAHAIMQDDVFVVDDATKDPRFANNPLVTAEPDIRFYAGAPLKTSDDFNLGTLCVIDRQPHSLTPRQRAVLDDLSHLVIDELELRLAGKTALGEVAERTRALEASETTYRRFVEYAHFGILIHRDMKIIYANPEAVHALGAASPDALMGKDVVEFIHPDSREDILVRRATIESDINIPLTDCTFLRTDGHAFPAEITGTLINNEGEPAIMTTFQDISARRMRESQLIQSNKLVTIGRLAAGVAHELSQPLNIMRLVKSSLESPSGDDVDREGAAAEDLSIIDEQVSRMADIIDHLAVFSSNDVSSAAPIDVSLAFANAVKFIDRRLQADKIALHVDDRLGEAPAFGSATQLEQVFLNLLTNARDAIVARNAEAGDTHRGHIHIELSARDTDGTLRIGITDDGGGFDTDITKNLFDAFFTTKEVGAGTGLGLSVCHSIIDSMGGAIEARNTDAGAHFEITLPSYTASQSNARPEGLDAGPSTDTARRILIVDDETIAADYLAAYLRRAGFATVTAANGNEAWAIFQNGAIDGVVTDIRMPGMDGNELVRCICETAPDTPVIFATGKREIDADDYGNASNIHIVTKPVDMFAIAEIMKTSFADR